MELENLKDDYMGKLNEQHKLLQTTKDDNQISSKNLSDMIYVLEEKLNLLNLENENNKK